MTHPVREGAAPLARIHDEIDRLFQEFPMPAFRLFGEPQGRAPTLDLYEKDGNVVIEAELPGIDRKDVTISYTDTTVTIRGETRREKEEKKEGYYRSERQYGSFHRTVPLPQGVDFEKAGAEFKDGVLTVTLPKCATPEVKTRTIPIAE